MDVFFTTLELVGTVAFSISGAIIGIRKEMDLLGVLILGVITATGGGFLRDLIVGTHPPIVFQDPMCLWAAIFTALVIFILCYYGRGLHETDFLNRLLFLADSLGLGIFTVNGVAAAEGVSGELSLLLFAGVLTGVGGGVLRDILAGNRPYIFVKHIYACASLAGAVLYVFCKNNTTEIAAATLGIFITVLLRLLASHFCWNLPRVALSK